MSCVINTTRNCRRVAQSGVTLVELLVSMAIALIVLTGVIQTMVDNKSKFIFAEHLGVIQENARFAMDELASEIRIAGNYGDCSLATSNVANTVNSVNAGIIFGSAIEGWDSSEGAGAFPANFPVDRIANTDAFVVRRADSSNAFAVGPNGVGPNSAGHIPSSATINVIGVHSIQDDTIMMVATPNCDQISIFQHQGGNPGKFVHNTGGGNANGNGGTNSINNCTKNLGGNFDCSAYSQNNNVATPITLPDGSLVMQFLNTFYYIAPSNIDNNIPALYKQYQTSSGAPVTTELLVGVENMQALYGIDVDNNGQADRYVAANLITGIAPLEWSNVVSVRLSLLFRSLDNVWIQNQIFVFEGANYNDRFARQRTTLTVQLRNIGL